MTANIKQIAIILVISIVLVFLLAWWAESRSSDDQPLLTNSGQTLNGPLSPEEQQITNPGITNNMNPIAVLKTNVGNISIELFEDQMPITVGNFIKLTNEEFYNTTKFHRVISGFMLQGGDPNSKGSNELIYGQGGPGYTIQDEFVVGTLLSNTRGTISMANTGQPNSGGSQFFINLVDNTNLDFDKEPTTSKHPVFGRVVDGMNVVDAIGSIETTTGNVPVKAMVIESVTIVREN